MASSSSCLNNNMDCQSPVAKHPDWFSPETGIYKSKHPSIHLPSDPFLDVVSFIFSRAHQGVSALIDSSSGYSISYTELYPLVKSMASGLRQMGVSQGDVVLILLPNSVYFPIIFLGVVYLGAIVTTMNPLCSFSEVKKQTLDCNVSLAFTLGDRVEKFDGLGVPAIRVPENVCFDSYRPGFSDFYRLILGDPSWVPRPKIHQHDTAAILFSSGTTGSCKGVELTHRNFIAMIKHFVGFEASQYEYLNEENVYLAVLPMFHVYGLSLFVMGLLSLGSAIVIMRKFDVEELTGAIEKYKVTHFPVVPPLLTALTARAKSVRGSVWKSLKQVSSGAAPLSSKKIEEFVHTFPHVDFIQGYGLTESTAVGTRGFNTKMLHNYSSVGLLAPNMEARVVDCITSSSLPPGKSGELWLKGPGIMKEATAATVDEDGWLHTGDIVYFDEEGYLYIFDRLKEMIKYKGFQIAPAELESVLVSHPDILDAAVTGNKDEKAGEVPVAFVVKRQGSLLREATVIDFVAKQVAPYKKVRKVVFTQSIPKSAAGKILRRELRSLVSRI
ncbi:4-coumarate--CoA ligase-like 6 isoform X2 [Diospyros lotus]|uniref:4-coumarate--CoA ligase-like 6 isoform X2 n=1 Tax=Diospyros lotus TaxID=55363 RepID=UPI00225AB115|nr:4-coumarate--CoA ligase-like 6 isoform X2 [Diospyros lotus]